jgi:hypothetical protein
MKKALKWILISVGAVILLAVLALAAHPLWLGSAVKGVACSAVPKITGTKFDVAGLSVNLYSGAVRVNGVELWNPANYDDKHAVTLDTLSVDVDMDTLNSDLIVIKDITIDGVYATYVKADGKYNFDVIAANAEQATASDPQADEPAAAGEPSPAEAKREVKVVIDRLTIRNVKVKYGFLTIPVPVEVVLTDLGRESNGVTLMEVVNKVCATVLNGIMAAGGGLESLGKGALGIGGEGLKNAGSSLKEAGKSLKGANDALKGVGEELKGLFKKK